MTALAAVLSEEERDDLVGFLGETLAPELRAAARAGDRVGLSALLDPLTAQEREVLIEALAWHWPPPPAPLTRFEDGTVDEVTVQRVAAGMSLPLTRTERDMVIRLMRRRGVTCREIGAHLGVSKSLVWKVAAAPVPEQTELFGEAS